MQKKGVGLSAFEKEVLGKVKEIPKGKVTAYLELARAVNRPGAAQAVGNALNKNPWAPRVPCHRVVKINGDVGGFAKGVKEKIRILKKEGILIKKRKVLFFDKIFYRF